MIGFKAAVGVPATTHVRPDASIGLREALLILVCLGSGVLIVSRALSGLDEEWDTLGYHLPFAARLAGICDVDCFRLRPFFESRFDGFPMFATWLQAMIWRVTGTPEYGDLINIAAFIAFVVSARVFLGAPLPLLASALLTVPLIQLHLTVTYVDLFANAMVGIAVVLILRNYLDGIATVWRELAPMVPLAAAVNSKYQMLPIAVGLVLVILGMFLARRHAGDRGKDTRFLLGFACLAALIFATELSNLYRFGNPVYPVSLDILGWTLPGTEPTVTPLSISRYWADTPRPLVWVASLWEIKAYVLRPFTWDPSQGTVAGDLSSFRMGGYFGTYVAANLIFFALILRNTRKPQARVICGFFIAISLLTAVLPANNELRYYMYWMIVLVLLNVVLCCRQNLTISAESQGVYREAYVWIVVVMFTAVAAISGGKAFLPSRPLAQILDDRGINSRVAEFQDASSVCLPMSAEPFAFLYTRVFHENRTYTIEQPSPVVEPACGRILK